MFVSYRRNDVPDATGRIADRLVQEFGRERVFQDVQNLDPGAPFAEAITAQLERCRAMVVVIGPRWDKTSKRSPLFGPDDWVRLEVEQALAAPQVTVIPVLVNGAQLPRPDALPAGMRSLLRRNALRIGPDPDFHAGMDRLLKPLRAVV